MPVDRSKRESYFPAIEKRYGEKITYWLKLLDKLKSEKYPDQMQLLQEGYGFSRAHANALVMYFRGSESSKRFEKPDDFFKDLDPIAAKTSRKIFRAIKEKYPELELVIAWNKPMLKLGDRYVFGLSVAKKHMLIAPFDSDVIARLANRLTEYEVNKKTIRIPLDWKVDEKLLHAIIRETLRKSG